MELSDTLGEPLLVVLFSIALCTFIVLNRPVLAVSSPTPLVIVKYFQNYSARQMLAADYTSDGNTLNATIWLRSHLDNATLRFGMIMSLDTRKNSSSYYDMYIQKEPKESFISHLEQFVNTYNTSGTYDNKTLDGLHAFEGSYDKGNKFVDLSLNLARIGSPSEYHLRFY